MSALTANRILQKRDSPVAPPALRVVKLRKLYGSLAALDEVSFSVNRGEIVGLLGPNGAGKTTTINMILGVLEPSSGRVAIDEIDIAKDRALALRRTNFAAVYAGVARQFDREREFALFRVAVCHRFAQRSRR